MTAADWNKGADIASVVLLDKPEVRRWNLFFTATNVHNEALATIKWRAGTVRKRARTTLGAVRERRAREDEKIAANAREVAELARAAAAAAAAAAGGGGGSGGGGGGGGGGAPEPLSLETSSSTVVEDLPSRFTVTTMREATERCICTINATGRAHAVQRWFNCITCGLTQGRGVCVPCARVCHAGHELGELKVNTFYCDCGAGEPIRAVDDPRETKLCTLVPQARDVRAMRQSLVDAARLRTARRSLSVDLGDDARHGFGPVAAAEARREARGTRPPPPRGGRAPPAPTRGGLGGGGGGGGGGAAEEKGGEREEDPVSPRRSARCRVQRGARVRL
jgi:hypothetical protein